jgi:uncharacterized protein (TIGR01777 family)
MGSSLAKYLRFAGHRVWILTRHNSDIETEIHWDGKSANGWGQRIDEMDAVVNMTGYGLEHWPWTKSQKKHFQDSRVLPGRALVSAIQISSHRPATFLQISGINYYGAHGDTIADEWTSPGGDYLAQLTIQWEAATQPVKELGVRYIVARSAVVLGSNGGLFPLMTLPVRLFVGGRLGTGNQAVPWIHIADQIGALRFLLENEQGRGVFNLISPTPTSNNEFMRAIASALHRPNWFPIPAFLFHVVLGEMSTLVVDGRYSLPKRLLEFGYQFRFPTIETAIQDIFK